MDILIIIGLLLVFGISIFLLFTSNELSKRRSNETTEVRDELYQWGEGLSKVSGIPIDQIWIMPSDKIEELRTKYNYK